MRVASPGSARRHSLCPNVSLLGRTKPRPQPPEDGAADAAPALTAPPAVRPLRSPASATRTSETDSRAPRPPVRETRVLVWDPGASGYSVGSMRIDSTLRERWDCSLFTASPQLHLPGCWNRPAGVPKAGEGAFPLFCRGAEPGDVLVPRGAHSDCAGIASGPPCCLLVRSTVPLSFKATSQTAELVPAWSLFQNVLRTSLGFSFKELSCI